ncbi:MAG TPA: trypsin-like peptidase domain-containing protein [Rectinemataceae bacterium]|nr:trypsin-like peptidase domain-containing protein [Rectinemataceae bacterium]
MKQGTLFTESRRPPLRRDEASSPPHRNGRPLVGKSMLMPAVLILAGVGFLLGLASFVFRPRIPTQKDVDSAVLYSLQHRPPVPSMGSLAYEAVRPSVVRVRQLSLNPADPSELGVGTGVILTETGLILTNFHVVVGAPRIGIVFADGTESEARLVNVEADRDLALLQALLVPDDLKPATLRSLAGLKVGDPVFAVGNPFGIGPSASAGIVSGLDRAYVEPGVGTLLTGLIQFDAAANPGNSGGPLVDGNGDVLGLVTSILNPTHERVFVGIGFAIPIQEAASGFALNPF